MRKQSLFNDSWLFAADKLDLDAPDSSFEDIHLPHSNKIFSYHNIDNLDYQTISTYRTRFEVDRDDQDSLVFLDFSGVMLASTVYLNGTMIGEYLGGFAPFKVNITENLINGENVLDVFVDSRERKDIPPFGHLVDYLTFGGIYRDVHLQILPGVHIKDVAIRTFDVLTAPRISADIQVNQLEPDLKIEAAIFNQEGKELAVTRMELEDILIKLEFNSLPEISLWDLDNPVLYTLKVSVLADNKLLDSLSSRFGFRKAEFKTDGGFYLNGERIQLFGLNRHQTYPYLGAAAPARLQRQDADILKKELACNIVRTSHYPQSAHFLDRCDEIGLLVFEEITGWQHIGDSAWQGLVEKELQAMIERDRNRPSVILWGVRVNESIDDDDFYTRTNQLAHDLDPTRQTGGVRCFLESSFLEDVFTYNDFSNTVLEPIQMPYLITEFAGHMFPTKIWDHEERLIDHALLHARIHDLQMGNPKISGAIGWCAFDYATHIEFGSGDRICYHGVMDTFRLPKWAAYFYRSQKSPEKEIVLKAATHWTMGDRSGGGNNPLTVFSNCEEVEILIGDINAGRVKPEFKAFPNLKHPPFVITGLDKFSAWGQREFYDLHVIGYINGEPAAEQWISSSRLPKKLELTSDVDQITADGSDLTRLVFRTTDEYGNPLPYATKIVNFEIDGDADLVGDNPFLLVGGQAAVYIRSRDVVGPVTIRATAEGLPPTKVTLDIVSVQK